MNGPAAPIDRLPAALAEIAEIIGVDGALAIAEARGGTEIYIPAAPGPDHWLIDVIGLEAAGKLCRHYRIAAPRRGESRGFRGVAVQIPLGDRGSFRRLRREVDRMIGEGRSAREIALACGYSTRGIERRKARHLQRRDPHQGELFDASQSELRSDACPRGGLCSTPGAPLAPPTAVGGKSRNSGA